MNAHLLIAILEDDASLRRSLIGVVESAGYEAIGFGEARAFLESPLARQPACLLLDVEMPDVETFEARDRVAMPVIFMAAEDDARTRQRLATSGTARRYLRRPFGATALLDAIRDALREH